MVSALARASSRQEAVHEGGLQSRQANIERMLSVSSHAPVRLIVGLGNPGTQYERTRHNAGFWLVDRLCDDFHASFALDRSFFGHVARLTLHGRQIHLIKPNTYMNRSGQAVGAVARFYRIAPEEILVVHDELDLPPGQARLKQGGGHAGHNGLRDIQSALGSPAFWRLRIGIGHPRQAGLAQPVADYVLHPPRAEELGLIQDAIERARAIVPTVLEGRFDQAIRQLHEGNR